MRLAVLAIAPIIVLDAILDLTSVNIPLWTLIGIVIELVYMVIAVRANATTAVPPPSGFPVNFPAGEYAPQQNQGLLPPNQ